jgi:hypothetical protein
MDVNVVLLVVIMASLLKIGSNLTENIDPVSLNTGSQYISYADNMKIQLKQKYDAKHER